MPRASRPSTIVTLTMNPTIDLSFSVDRLQAGAKLRCHDLRRDPGGGGVNVARVVRRLGGRSLAIFPAGGSNGARLQAMLKAERTAHLALPIGGETREDITAQDASTDAQFRFIMPGPRLKNEELAETLGALDALTPRPRVLVASGSLPPGAPAGFYGRLARLVRSWGGRLAVDASGLPLRRAVEAGVWLVKPNLAELEELAAATLPDLDSRAAACRTVIETGGAEIVALTMGAEGALLVTRDEAWRAAAPSVAPISTVGAGDSFTGALVTALSAGSAYPEALALAVAAGTAALLAPGTQLCRRTGVQALARRVRFERLSAGEPRATRSPPAAA
ncbi:MAG TPA: 1-phosphofructokinase family hexose kinase [Caulobacteraceae bacterium]|nr:1-phosphofructokinase family hexose kinase [Caulobacteraceae bacterium]